MTTPTPTDASATQLDRIAAVALAVGYIVGLAWFLNDDATDRVIAYYIGAGTLVILPTIVYLLSRVWAFRGISDKLDALHMTTEAIEKQTNGALTARLETQTSEIVTRILEGMKETPNDETSGPSGSNGTGTYTPERVYAETDA